MSSVANWGPNHPAWPPEPFFGKKHGAAERWSFCDCDDCKSGRAPLDQAIADERAIREAPPTWESHRGSA